MTNPPSNYSRIRTLQEQLIFATGTKATADLLIALTIPLVATLSNGEEVYLLGVPQTVVRLTEQGVTSIRPIQPFNHKIEMLRLALSKHRFGKIVIVDLYDVIPEDLRTIRFQDNPGQIAKRLAGSLIQSGSEALMVLKVEVYGCTTAEDPNCINVSHSPSTDLYVRSIMQSGVKKVIIGTRTWRALVTCGVVMKNGKIIVGPHNTEFLPADESILWVRKDWDRNILTVRHIESKFDSPTALAKYASEFHVISVSGCAPVTLESLWKHCSSSNDDGRKAIAHIFSELYAKEALLIKSIKKALGMIRDRQTTIRGDAQIKRDIKSLLEASKSKESEGKVVVDSDISDCLQALAKHVSEFITQLNNRDVVNKIERCFYTAIYS